MVVAALRARAHDRCAPSHRIKLTDSASHHGQCPYLCIDICKYTKYTKISIIPQAEPWFGLFCSRNSCTLYPVCRIIYIYIYPTISTTWASELETFLGNLTIYKETGRANRVEIPSDASWLSVIQCAKTVPEPLVLEHDCYGQSLHRWPPANF